MYTTVMWLHVSACAGAAAVPSIAIDGRRYRAGITREPARRLRREEHDRGALEVVRGRRAEQEAVVRWLDVREIGRRGARRDLDDLRFGKDVLHRDDLAAAGRADHGGDVLVREGLRDAFVTMSRLVALIVDDLERDLTAEHAAGGVDLVLGGVDRVARAAGEAAKVLREDASETPITIGGSARRLRRSPSGTRARSRASSRRSPRPSNAHRCSRRSRQQSRSLPRDYRTAPLTQLESRCSSGSLRPT